MLYEERDGMEEMKITTDLRQKLSADLSKTGRNLLKKV